MQSPEVTGRVAAIVNGNGTREVDVAVETTVGCARCQAGRGCGAGLPGVAGADRLLRVAIPPGVTLVTGDPVTLRIGGTALLTAAVIAYGLPLAGLLLGAALGHLLIPGDIGALLAALAGLIGGAWLARRRAAHFCWQHRADGLLRLEAGTRR